MPPIISSENSNGVDETTLTGTGEGGLLSGGYLREDPIESYLGDDEVPVFALSNGESGVTRESMAGESWERDEQLRPGDGYRAFAIATDVRLLFLVGDSESGPDGDRSVNVPLVDVEVVDSTEGIVTSELLVTTAADTRWRFPVRGSVEEAASYLDAASVVWLDVEGHVESARTSVVETTEHVEDHDYEAAFQAVRDAMAETDAARRRERDLRADGVPAIDERIDRIEERITDARIRVREARATHHLGEAERLWRQGDYGVAHEAFTDAHDDYMAALSVGDPDFDDSRDLRARLARVERNLAALERAPVERADELRTEAGGTDDPAERATLLADALASYRTALELDWGRSAKRFEVDTDEIRERIDGVARDLVETRRRVASRRVERAEGHAAADRYEAAAEDYQTAREALECAADTARELAPDALAAVTDHRDAVDRRLADVREHLPDDADVDPDAGDGDVDGGASRDDSNVDDGPGPMDDDTLVLYSPT